MNKMIIHKFIKWLVLLAVILAGTIIYTDSVDASPLKQTTDVAQVVVIYRSSCGSTCLNLFDTVLQPLIEKSGNSLEIVFIDADLTVNSSIVNRLISHYKISADSTPILLTETDILIGLEQIQTGAESVILKSLQSGGNRPPLLLASSGIYASDEIMTELNNTKAELTNTKGDLANTKSNLENANNQVNTFQLGLIFAGGLAFVFIIVSIGLLINTYRISRTNRSLQHKVNKTMQMLSESEAKFVGTLIGQGSSGVDFLAEMAKVQIEYQRRKTISENAAFLARDFLMMVEKYMGIVPLAQLGAQVTFDPKIHKSYQNLKPGTVAWVVEPGWKRKDQILKYAVVQAKTS